MAQSGIQSLLDNISNQPSTSGLKNINFPTGSPAPNHSDLEEYSVVEDIPPTSQSTRMTNIWSYHQTVCLIKSMGTFYNDFSDVRKRKHIFENVANDLISHGFSVDPKLVQNKWKGLLRSYSKAKDTKNRTGQGPSRFLFYEIIDDIVGHHPKNSCNHSLNILETSEIIDREYVESSSEIVNVQNSEEQEVESSNNVEKFNEEHPNSTRKKRSRFSGKQNQKDYMELKREEYKKRQKRHEERCLLETERNETEKKRLAILEEYLKNKLNKPPL